MTARIGLRSAPRPVALVAAAGTVVALLLGCTPTVPPPPGPTPAVSSTGVTPPGAPTSAGSAPSEAGGPSSERQPPPRPTAPPATTAGPLGAADLPGTLPGGFRATERPPAEEERLPNGSWVYEAPAGQAAWEAVPRCAANDGRDWPAARFALGGTYLDASGRPGNALVIEFSDAASAQQYASTYRAVLASCPPADGMPAAKKIADAAGWYVGRRSYGSDQWSEVVALRGTRIWLAIWNDGGTTPPAELTGLAERLAGG